MAFEHEHDIVSVEQRIKDEGLPNIPYFTFEEQQIFVKNHPIVKGATINTLEQIQGSFTQQNIPLLIPRKSSYNEKWTYQELESFAMQGVKVYQNKEDGIPQFPYIYDIVGSSKAPEYKTYYERFLTTEKPDTRIYSGTISSKRPPRESIFKTETKDIVISGTKPFEKPLRKSVFKTVRDVEEAYEMFPEASAEVQQQLGTEGLSQETLKIIDDWATKKILIPTWFIQNNMQWLLERKITEQEFLVGYQNLVNTGIIRYPEDITKLITTNFQVIIQDITKYSTSLSNEDYKRLEDEMMFEDRVTLVFLNQTDFNPLDNFTNALLKIQGLLPEELPPDEPDKPKPEDILPNANMVRQEIGRFQVVNKTLKGKITYIATDNFDKHFYYNFENNSGEILKCYVIATDNEGNVLLSKQNDLRFSETERDETITISDYVDTEENKITVEFYVTNTPTQDSFEDDFAFVRTITTPYLPKKPDTLFGALFGLIAIPTALTLLGRKT
jgi:hypothetical protein